MGTIKGHSFLHNIIKIVVAMPYDTANTYTFYNKYINHTDNLVQVMRGHHVIEEFPIKNVIRIRYVDG